MKVNIEVSARHIHLMEEDFFALFGKKDLTPVKNLSQQDFTTSYSVEIIRKDKTIKNVMVIGPFREKSQLEISRTDAIVLGIDAPLKISGDLPGSTVTIQMNSQRITKDFAIVAKRHLHLSPDVARELNLNNNDKVSIQIDGERSVVLNEVIVRIDERFTLAVHLDTDEGNAVGITGETLGDIIIGK